MTDKSKDGEMTPEGTAEVTVRVEREWDAFEEAPSDVPGFEGATPRKLARAPLNLGRRQ